MKRFIFSTIAVLTFSALIGVGVFYIYGAMTRSDDPHTAYIQDGDVIQITASEQIDFRLYAENAKGSTKISQNGVVVCSTKPGAKEGYFDTSGKINPGRYIVSGSDATLKLSGKAIILNPGYDQRHLDDQLLIARAMAVFSAIYFTWAFIYISHQNNIKEDNS